MGGYFGTRLAPRFFDAGLPILEITESSAMLAPERVMHFMRDLRQRGITFALDDFGAGTT